MTVAGILEHEEAFQAIADANDDTRAAGTSGYDASLDYVRSQLDPSYFTIAEQEFEFPYLRSSRRPSSSESRPSRVTMWSRTTLSPWTTPAAAT